MYVRNKSKIKSTGSDEPVEDASASRETTLREAKAAILRFERMTGVNRREHDQKLGQRVLEIIAASESRGYAKYDESNKRRMADARAAATALLAGVS